MSDRRLTIELVVGSGNAGGTERQVLGLAARLRDRGHDISVLLLEGVGPLIDELSAQAIPYSSVGFGGISPSRVPSIPTTRSVKGLMRVTANRRRRHRTIELSHAFLDGSVAVAPLLDLFNGRRPIRVAGVRGFRDGDPRLRSLFARHVRRADAVVCNAPHLVEEMINDFGVERGRAQWIANGVDLPAVLAEVAEEPPRGVVVANFHAYKGYDVLVDACERLHVPPLIRLCGVGPERDATAARIQAARLQSRLTFVDPPADVPTELLNAQFAIHPSRTEGMSNAILEALAAGLPVIACDVGANAELITHGVNGLLVRAGDPVALAGAIERMASDRQMRLQMSRAARARAEAFAWEACVLRHEQLYDELVGRHR
jgi:glycosyltransferase involved in cell wall biosynthesis